MSKVLAQLTALQKNEEIAEIADIAFTWVEKGGRELTLVEIDTSHLFNIIRMIWNHNMPADAVTHEYTRYNFFLQGQTHDEIANCFAIALYNMIPELEQRPDFKTTLSDTQRGQYFYMKNYFARPSLPMGIVKQKEKTRTPDPEKIANTDGWGEYDEEGWT